MPLLPPRHWREKMQKRVSLSLVGPFPRKDYDPRIRMMLIHLVSKKRMHLVVMFLELLHPQRPTMRRKTKKTRPTRTTEMQRRRRRMLTTTRRQRTTITTRMRPRRKRKIPRRKQKPPPKARSSNINDIQSPNTTKTCLPPNHDETFANTGRYQLDIPWDLLEGLLFVAEVRHVKLEDEEEEVDTTKTVVEDTVVVAEGVAVEDGMMIAGDARKEVEVMR
mmetsp:Transcript_680/g.938  ORF Transcript_680/g.938 Transcript_680/m.938 type:complete len:220 (+) Transcript_680:1421-2080(+)